MYKFYVYINFKYKYMCTYVHIYMYMYVHMYKQIKNKLQYIKIIIVFIMDIPLRIPIYTVFLKLSDFNSKKINEIVFLFSCRNYSAFLVTEIGLLLCQSSHLMYALTQKFRPKMLYHQCNIPSCCCVTELQFIQA